MPRKVEISLPADRTDDLIAEINQISEVISLRVQKNISLNPEGDVISLEVTDRSLHRLMQMLEQKNMLQDPKISVTTSLPLSIISQPRALQITNDTSEATWEEMQATISRQSNMTTNGLLTMALSGIIAAIGISTNALHLVIGAMVIAPGFEPIIRIPLGLTTANIDWKKGLSDTAKGYGVMLLAAMAMALVLQAMGQSPLSSKASYLSENALVSYWTTINLTSLIVSIAASIVGALVIISHRPVLTAGVMIALALVPGMTIAGMALVSGEFDIAWLGVQRWALDAACVALVPALVFLWKKRLVHKRNSWV